MRRSMVAGRSMTATRWAASLAAVVVAGLAALLGARAASAQDAPAPAGAPAPRVAFDTKMLEFGQVVSGRSVEGAFTLRNAGTADLVIRQIKPACGCTAVLSSHKVLAPGAAAKLAVSFDSKDRHGFQEVQILLVTNDPRERDAGDYTSLLRLRAEVVHLVDVLPMSVYLPSYRRGTEQVREVTILPRAAGALGVTRLEASASFLELSHAPYAAGPRQGVRIRVRVTPDAPIGRLDEQVVVHTDHPEQPRVLLPVLGAIHGELIHFPDRIAMSPKPGEPGEATLVLKRTGGEGPIGVYHVEAPSFVIVEHDVIIPGLQSEVRLRTRDGLAPGPYAGTVALWLDHGEQARIEVPVTAVLAPQVRVEPGAIWAAEGAPGGAAVPMRVFVQLPPGRRLLGAEGFGARVRADGHVEVPALARAAFGPEAKPEAGRLAGVVRLRTDVPGEEQIEVPVVLRLGEAP